MALFDNSDPEKLLFFISNFNMTLKASRILVASAIIQYLRTLLRGEALHQFDTLSIEAGSTNSEALKSIILDLGTYLFPDNALSNNNKKRCAAE